MADEVIDDRQDVSDDELMADLFETVSFSGEVRPWREVPETELSEDEGDHPSGLDEATLQDVADIFGVDVTDLRDVGPHLVVHLQADKGGHRGLMVSVPVPPELGSALQVLDGVPPEDMHVTLCYVKGSTLDTLSAEEIADLYDVVRDVVEREAPISFRVEGLGRFDATEHSDDLDVLYAKVSGDALLSLRTKIYKALTKAGAEPAHNFEYAPHITLSYVDPAEEHDLSGGPATEVPVTTVHVQRESGPVALRLGTQLETEAAAQASLSRLATVVEGGVPSVRAADVFKRPATATRAALNRKTTANAIMDVDLAALEPGQPLIPVNGLARYISKPRKDPADILHIATRSGRTRWVIQEGHTRLAAAALRGELTQQARVWQFEETAAGDLAPVARGMHKRGREVYLSYRDKLADVFNLERDQRAAALKAWDTRGRSDSFGKSDASTWTPEHHDTNKVYRGADGDFTPARKVLHEDLLSKALAIAQPAPAGEPLTAYLVAGGSGSGKTTFRKKGLIEGLPTDTGAVYANADEYKEQLPEYQDAKAAKNPYAAMITHDESSHLAHELTRRGFQEKKHVIVDAVGDSGIEKLTDRIASMRKAGAQRVVANYVTVSTAEAKRRADLRFKETGRAVPESVIRENHKDVSRTFVAAVRTRLFDEVALYDNSSTGKLIARSEGDRFVIHDREAWREFLRKAHE